MSTDDVPSASLCDQPTVQRDPQKRRVKLVQKHLLQVDFGLDDSEDDSDFDIEQHQESDSLDEMDEDEDQGLTLQSSDLPENKIISPDNSEDDKFDKVQGLEYDNMEEEEEEDNEEDDEDEEEDSSESSEEDEEDEEEASEPQKPKGLHGIFGSVDSSDEDDEDYVPCKKKKKKLDAQEPVKKTSLDTVSNSFPAADAASHTSGQAQGQIKVLICCVCLSDQSADDDEIVECDNCGISVHEGCYGISESQSTASTESSASTEPWFCDACKAGVIPHCELCPNSGGIYKETDAGKWVHIVCALYTPGVAFGDVDRLCPVTLFEMAYTKWGAKECSLCEDSRFSRTGVCISCDAGMCRSYFHVTCAQREGLLTEAAPEEVMDIADPFFAYCKQHADKTTVKARRRHWLAIQSHVRSYTPKVIDDEMERSRFERKLNRHREKYAIARNKRPPSWVPTQKMVRHLHTSPYAVKAFMRKAELMGVVTHVENAHQEKPEMRKKAHLTPALSTEYIQYYFGRNMKIDSMRQNLKDLTTQNAKLQDQEKVLRNQYEKLSFDMDKLHELSARHRREGERIWNALADIGGKSIVVPEMFRPKKRQRSPSKKENPCSPPSVIHQCGICQQTTDQHLLTKCDSCHRHYHLSCLDPPLTRMPKKTKLMGWQCSQCVSSNSSASEGGCVPKVDEPRRLRENIKEPIKFRQMQHYEYAKGKRVSTVKGKKKKSKLPLIPVPETKSPAKSPVASPSAAAASPIHTSNPIPHVPTPLPPKETKLTRRKEIEPRIKEIRLSRGFAFESQPIPIVRLRKEDAASICVVCNKPGDVTNTVRCDECLLSYHFHCLEPPVKKSPKVRGYTWHCEACDPTDHSEEEENSSQSASTSSKSGKNNVTIASGPSKGSDSKR